MTILMQPQIQPGKPQNNYMAGAGMFPALAIFMR